MKRLLAVIGAAAMIGAALYVRASLDDEDSPGGPGGSDITIACIRELEDACRALDRAEDSLTVVVQDAGDTLEALKAGEADFDGWITLDPWPAIVGEARSQQRPGEPSQPIASTSLVIAAVRRDGQLPCSGEVTWRCLGDGSATVALPAEDATGLLLLGQAAAGCFGSVEFASNDFENDPEFASCVSRIRDEVNPDPLGRLLRELPAAFVLAVGATEADYDVQVLGFRREGELVKVEPEPSVTVAVVIVPIEGADEDRVTDLADRDELREALDETGWDVGNTPTSGLPDPGVLLYLLTL